MQQSRKIIINTFLLLMALGLVFVWQLFSSYSDSSTVKKSNYLIKFNLSSLEPGEVRFLHKNGLPIVVMRRTKQDLKQLIELRSHLSDPDSKHSQQPGYAKNYYRSLKPEFFIAYAVIPVTGSSIHYRLDSFQTLYNKEGNWFGGFSGTTAEQLFDKAGRSYFSTVNNLQVPNYKLNSQNQLYVYTLKSLEFN